MGKEESWIRRRIEHAFGHMENSMGGSNFEYIGIKRIETAVELRNLTCRFARYAQLIKLNFAYSVTLAKTDYRPCLYLKCTGSDLPSRRAATPSWCPGFDKIVSSRGSM